MVEGVGVEELEAVGLTPESFSSDDDLPQGLEPEQARAIVDGIAGCIDMEELLLAGFAEDGALSDEARECLTEQFDDDLMERVLVVMLTEGEDGLDVNSGVGAEIIEAYTACPEAMG